MNTTNSIAVPPAQRPSQFASYYAIYLLCTIVPYLCLMLLLAIFVPRFEEVFKDFKVALPLVTEKILALSQACRNFYSVPFLLIPPLVLPFVPAFLSDHAQAAGKPTSRVTLLYVLFVLLLAALFAITVALSIYLPLTHMIQSVSGEGR